MRAGTISACLLASIASQVLSAPLPQLAGEGAACNSILSQTDNGVGYGVENAEDNTAALISSHHPRQLAGEGAACNSILSQTDNGVGYGVKNAEDNTAALITKTEVKPARRQLDKIANGAGNIGDALHIGTTTGPVVQQADTLDGQTTSDGATLGQQIGDDEATTLENAGKLVPKMLARQLDKIANGAGNIGNALGAGPNTAPVVQQLDTLDGQTTSDGATIGQQVGDDEATALENAGKAVPK